MLKTLRRFYKLRSRNHSPSCGLGRVDTEISVVTYLWSTFAADRELESCESDGVGGFGMQTNGCRFGNSGTRNLLKLATENMHIGVATWPAEDIQTVAQQTTAESATVENEIDVNIASEN